MAHSWIGFVEPPRDFEEADQRAAATGRAREATMPVRLRWPKPRWFGGLVVRSEELGEATCGIVAGKARRTKCQ